ncbi:universal stress protein [Aestuariimicrobium ganziense]|uniref:universal stress protein n=1 Tax=Aestuariimicrobium ganziense TaxID=2773677 RepID=UPI0019458879|nr:universal stress protein [Aestuariimicrobium ganziense]
MSDVDFTDRIVVGTDLSHPARGAVDWAAQRAARDGKVLLIVLVLPELPLPRKGHVFAAMRDGNYLAQLTERAEKKLAGERDRVAMDHPSLVIETAVVEGIASYVLARATKTATMVVIAARGERVPVGVRALGGTADAVATHAHGPVAVVTGTEFHPDGPIVVGVDDSTAARAAMEFASEEASRTNKPLRVVHTWNIGPRELHAAELGTYDLTTVTEAADRAVTEWLAPTISKYPMLSIDRIVAHGSAGQALVEQSKDASLVVVGSRGRGGFTALLLGSTSKEVLRQSHSPVVVLRG